MSQICDFWIAEVGPIKIDMWIDERKGTKIKFCHRMSKYLFTNPKNNRRLVFMIQITNISETYIIYC